MCIRDRSYHFNPRAPRGARHKESRNASLRVEFQSTRPARGATEIECKRNKRSLFQSTRPARGATIYGGNIGGMPGYFNPRAPRGARPTLAASGAWLPIFQSTRPARGATARFFHWWRRRESFQSTRPARGATRTRERRKIRDNFNPRAPRGARQRQEKQTVKVNFISIHAPREGRDRSSNIINSRIRNFNPRAPRGARRGGNNGRY